jgi:hypothetical protein
MREVPGAQSAGQVLLLVQVEFELASQRGTAGSAAACARGQRLSLQQLGLMGLLQPPAACTGPCGAGHVSPA